MKRLAMLLFLAATYAFAACPTNVRCDIYGMQMYNLVPCDYNSQTHKRVCKYQHDWYEGGKSVIHYNIRAVRLTASPCWGCWKRLPARNQ